MVLHLFMCIYMYMDIKGGEGEREEGRKGGREGGRRGRGKKREREVIQRREGEEGGRKGGEGDVYAYVSVRFVGENCIC